MSEARFDISLPGLYKEKWREAYRADKDDSPRLSSYQAPDGDPIPFIYKSIDFSGGQAIDCCEYPFFGLWSNETLNIKPQTITVLGYLRGEFYLQQRADFIDALMVATSDDSPGFFDHPLWGRFKVVVENYNIMESANENGQCEISLTLKRAGVSLEARTQELSPQELAKPEDAAAAAVEAFAKTETNFGTLSQAFGIIKTRLLNVTGVLQLPQALINSIADEVTGISNIISQDIRSPILLAQAMVKPAFSIASAVISVGDSVRAVGAYFSGRNKRKATLQFLSANGWTLPIESATVQQAETKKATENLYRIISLCAAAKIMMSMVEATQNQMAGYWSLYSKLENCLNLENPDVYMAIMEMRAALATKLRQNALNNELVKKLKTPVPLLFLAHYLGCDEDKLRSMNAIDNSFLVSGDVAYV